MTLYQKVRELYEYQCRKHELASDDVQYATDEINKMSNDELLQAISNALEDVKQKLEW